MEKTTMHEHWTVITMYNYFMITLLSGGYEPNQMTITNQTVENHNRDACATQSHRKIENQLDSLSSASFP